MSDLKQDFQAIDNLGGIVDVLKTTTLVQSRMFQSRERPCDDFSVEAEAILETLRGRSEMAVRRHPLFCERPDLPAIIVVVTTEEGFLGELNTLLVNTALDQRTSPRDEIIVLGDRGMRYLEDAGQSYTGFPGLSDDISVSEVERLRDYVWGEYRKRFGKMIMVYPRFISLMVHKIAVWHGLPYQRPEDLSRTPAGPGRSKLVAEPSLGRVLDGLAELWLSGKFLSLFWSSRQAQYAARIMHLESSGQELQHRRRGLLLEYFRNVHEARDKSIREITASRLIVRKK